MKGPLFQLAFESLWSIGVSIRQQFRLRHDIRYLQFIFLLKQADHIINRLVLLIP